ncbi:MAG: hypothetical protein M0P58_07545 [Bacteroidales bacterium]|nr:hypothetical protein [Bacteroidales bacterium]
MKQVLTITIFSLLLQSAFSQNMNPVPDNAGTLRMNKSIAVDRNDKTNNFYDNEVTYSLPVADLEIAGEVENPGKIDFSGLPKHSVIVKETLLKEDGSNAFIGAYRYDGYSLFDILNDRILKKKNKADFSPIIDAYVEIENAKGEKVILTWGEIYYPNFLHNIIIATDAMRIVPSKTKDLWPLPAESRLIVGGDLITERNISSPVRITVKSYARSFAVNREMKPLYSPEIIIHNQTKTVESISSLPSTLQTETLHTIFYGKGRGIHSTQPFSGVFLKDVLRKDFSFSKNNLRTGLVAVVGKDGYRSVYSFSEIANRNDQAGILVVPCAKDEDGGKFRIFPSCDFFSDRAVKAVSDIFMENIQ